VFEFYPFYPLGPHHLFHSITEEADGPLHMTRRLA